MSRRQREAGKEVQRAESREWHSYGKRQQLGGKGQLWEFKREVKQLWLPALDLVWPGGGPQSGGERDDGGEGSRGSAFGLF